MRVAALRHIGPYWQIGPCFDRLMHWAEQNHVNAVGPCLAIYHDDPATTPEAELRSDACLQVAPDFTTDDSQITVIDIPGGRYAVALHVGEYSGLAATWKRFMDEWFPASGFELDESRPCFEVYVDDCAVTPADELRTEIFEPVK